MFDTKISLIGGAVMALMGFLMIKFSGVIVIFKLLGTAFIVGGVIIVPLVLLLSNSIPFLLGRIFGPRT